MGGAGDVLESPLGMRIPICNVELGWTAQARKNYIDFRDMGLSYFRGIKKQVTYMYVLYMCIL